MTAEQRIRMLSRVAVSYFYTQEYEKAWGAIAAAELLVSKNGLADLPFMSEIYAYGSLISTDQKKRERAKLYADRALERAALDFGADSAETGLAYNALGYFSFKTGDLKTAKGQMCKAAMLSEKHLPDDDPMVVNNLTSCGVIMYFQDDTGTADMMERAARIAHNNLPSDHPVTLLALTGSAGVLMQLGRYAEAEALFRRLTRLERQLRKKDSPEVFSPMSMHADALFAQDKTAEALAIAQAALAYSKTMKAGGDPSSQGHAYSQVARILSSLGRHEEALDLYRLGWATNVANLKEGDMNIGITEITYAQSLMINGQLDEALKHAESARRKLLEKLGGSSRRAINAEFSYAEILAASGQMDKAITVARSASVRLEEHLFDYTASRPQLVSLSPIMTQGFASYAAVAMQAGEDAEAVKAVQLALASELFLANADLAAKAAARDEGVGDLFEQLRQERAAERKAKEKLFSAQAKGEGDFSVLSLTAENLGLQVKDTERELNNRFPELAEISRPAVPSLLEIQSNLRPEQAAIFSLTLPDKIITLAVTKDAVHWSKSAISGRVAMDYRKRLFQSIEDYRFAVSGPVQTTFDTDAAHQLFKLLFTDELYAKLDENTELLFPASGILASISPALLLTKPYENSNDLARAPWLVRDKSVAIATDLSKQLATTDDSTDIRFAGLGAPELAQNSQGQISYAALFRGGAVDISSLLELPTLPAAKTELTRMSEEFGAQNSLVLTGKQFTEPAIRSLDFTPFSVVTFATHGLTSGEIAGLSEPALVFTPPNEQSHEDDGLLTASEIAGMNIPADWVILSACNSGGGQSASAPTYSGLAKAFRLAGSRSLLLSHWPVRDDAATILSLATVKGAVVDGLSRAEALRQAQLDLMSDSTVPGSAHPAVWAPFILIGD
ncbi:CHAT domain-containing tetratricopeptide repeat protein [Parasphingorhabdus sp.]